MIFNLVLMVCIFKKIRVPYGIYNLSFNNCTSLYNKENITNLRGYRLCKTIFTILLILIIKVISHLSTEFKVSDILYYNKIKINTVNFKFTSLFFISGNSNKFIPWYDIFQDTPHRFFMRSLILRVTTLYLPKHRRCILFL